jgi:hypothetical protein
MSRHNIGNSAEFSLSRQKQKEVSWSIRSTKEGLEVDLQKKWV